MRNFTPLLSNGGAKCTIRGTWYQGRFALLTPGSSDGVKNAPIAFSKKTMSCFSLKKREE